MKRCLCAFRTNLFLVFHRPFMQNNRSYSEVNYKLTWEVNMLLPLTLSLQIVL